MAITHTTPFLKMQTATTKKKKKTKNLLLCPNASELLTQLRFEFSGKNFEGGAEKKSKKPQHLGFPRGPPPWY